MKKGGLTHSRRVTRLTDGQPYDWIGAHSDMYLKKGKNRQQYEVPHKMLLVELEGSQ